MVGIYIKALMKGASKVSPTIKSVKPSVPKTKLEKAKSKLAIAKQKTKASGARLKQTLFNLKEDRKKLNLREKKMGGGMMGRRFGYSEGSKKGKIPTTPKEKSLAKLAPPRDKITFGDVVAGRTKGKRMQAKDGTGPEQFMRSGVKEDPMRDRTKQPFKTIKNTPGPQFKKDRKRKIGSNVYRRKP
jgi:hypothetical protein